MSSVSQKPPTSGRNGVSSSPVHHRLAAVLAGMPSTYIVGGTVRDMLLQRTAADYDIATGQPPAEIAAEVARRTDGRCIVFKKHDFAVYRVVSRRDGIFDVSAIYGQTLEDDLRNRDFTINAMALEPASGRIIDPLGGEQDLRAGLLRLVSPQAFDKDPVRLLRAFRLSAEFDLQLSQPTQAAIVSHAERIGSMPGERIRQELLKLLGSSRAAGRLRAMAETGLMRHIIPQWTALSHLKVSHHSPTTAQALALSTVAELESCGAAARDNCHPVTGRSIPVSALIKLGALLADIGRPDVRRPTPTRGWCDPSAVPRTAAAADALLHRLRFSRRERAEVGVLVKTLHRPAALHVAKSAGRLTDLAAIRFFMAAGDLVPAVLLLSLARQRGLSRFTDDFEACMHFLRNAYETVYCIRLQDPPLMRGSDLMAALDLPPGPRVGQLLSVLRQHQLAGAITSPAAARALAEKRCKALPPVYLEPPHDKKALPA